MANTQAIKRRIRSVNNTKQITKAMELVAASKMRRAQEATLASKAYANTAADLLTRLSRLTDVSKHPYFDQRKVETRLHILISSDRGLAGAYNSNILKAFIAALEQDKQNDIKSEVIVIGKKGSPLATRLEHVRVRGVYDSLPDKITAQTIQPIIDSILKAFLDKQVDEINVIYTEFKSTISQKVETVTLLPAAFVPVELRESADKDVDFEPSPEDVVSQITPRLVEVQLLQAMLEASASEHSMRMLAMKSASDNATDLVDDLTLVYNSARQAAITQELAEITGGAEAIA